MDERVHSLQHQAKNVAAKDNFEKDFYKLMSISARQWKTSINIET